MSHFDGRDGFSWFMGVCEDRNDPKSMGRIRVRVFGYHTDDLAKLPTQDLPWAMVMLPPNVGTNGFHNIKPGDWVFGFWRDPDALQQPIIMGIMSGIPSYDADATKGFNDPNSPSAPDTQNEKYKENPDYGPYPLHTDYPDMSRLSGTIKDRNGEPQPHPEIEERDAAFTESVPIANGMPIAQDDSVLTKNAIDPGVDSRSTWEEEIATNVDQSATTWNEPKTTDESIEGAWADGINPETGELRQPPYKRRNTEYPYNHVMETESGHIKEYDDTPFAERIYEKHKSGTFYEIDADGNRVTRIVGQDYEIVAGHKFVNIKGDVNLTIDSNCKTYIKGDWNIQVDGSVHEVIKGTMTQEVIGDVFETYSGNQTTDITLQKTQTIGTSKVEDVGSNVTETIGGSQSTSIDGNLEYTASRIDLN